MAESRTRQNRRTSIVEAAEELFYINGISNSHMKDIAEKAGIGRSTLYEYFNRKEEIMLLVRKDYLDRIYNFDIELNCDTGFKMVEAILHKYLERLLNNPKELVFFMEYNRLSLPEDIYDASIINRTDYRMYQKINEALLTGYEDGSFSIPNASKKLEIIDEVLFGVAMRFSSKREYRYLTSTVSKDDIKDIIPMIMYGILNTFETE